MAIKDEMLDELLKDCKTQNDIMGPKGIVKQLTKRLLEKAMSAEMTEHLGYGKYSLDGRDNGNSRNGKGQAMSRYWV